MRYKLLMSFLMFMAVMTRGVEVRAVEVGTEINRNLLDLSNLVVSDDSTYLATTKDPIVLEAGVLHTVVLDYGFIGQHAGYVDFLMMSVEDRDGVSLDVPFEDDVNQRRIHASFVATTDEVTISNIPVLPESSYDAMIYEGSYQDFSGFIPFGRDRRCSGTIEFDASNPPSSDDLSALVSGTGTGGMPLSIRMDDEAYQGRTTPTGMFLVTYEAEDQGVMVTFDLDVSLVDRTPPVIEVITEMGPYETFDVDPSVLIGALDVSDDVDEMTRSDIRIVSNAMIGATEPGTYEVVFEAKDTSGNETILSVMVVVFENEGPEISGPPDVFIYASDIPMSDEEIIGRYEAFDVSDNQFVDLVMVYDEYQKSQTPGVYRVTLSAEDSHGLASLKHINIHVVRDAAPVLSLSDGIIRTTVDDVLDESELIRIMTERYLALGMMITEIRISDNDYLLSPDQRGEYLVTINYVLEERVMSDEILVIVSEADQNIPWVTIISVMILGLGIGVVFYLEKFRRRKQ